MSSSGVGGSVFITDGVVMIPCTVISGGLFFLMFAATNLGGTIGFGILYGFFSGGCASRSLRNAIGHQITFAFSVISLITPAAASFSRDLNEIGQVFKLCLKK